MLSALDNANVKGTVVDPVPALAHPPTTILEQIQPHIVHSFTRLFLVHISLTAFPISLVITAGEPLVRRAVPAYAQLRLLPALKNFLSRHTSLSLRVALQPTFHNVLLILRLIALDACLILTVDQLIQTLVLIPLGEYLQSLPLDLLGGTPLLHQIPQGRIV